VTWWRRHPWILPFALLLLLVAAGVAQLKVSTIEFVNEDIRKVLATGGVGLAVTAVAGLLVTAVFKSIEQVREIRKEQLRVVRNISDAYHKVKAGQRQLRALGFLEKLEVPLPENVAQAAHAVLNELNAQQLFFEELTEDPEVAQLFKCQPEVSMRLTKVAAYLQKRVVRPWEVAGSALLTKGDRGNLTDLVPFVSFAVQDDSDFKDEVTEPLKDARSAMLKEVFGPRGGRHRKLAGRRSA